ncbi:hypothetical protein QMP26_19615 [Enterocloster clostridioformis]|uniref:hypothetical protein n=1 Tax=Enterocloster clostridioformis TaxID=1531 RepID=UPI002676A0A8|nr:hypothetical protein [Enterocloster clostridioformis]
MEDLKLSIKNNNDFVPYKIKDVLVGKELLKIAGPCSIESKDQILRIASVVRISGAKHN